MSLATRSSMTPVSPSSRIGEPAWELATLYPAQGDWTEGDYLALDTNRLIELCNGCVELLY